jgi:hypothetical protein
MSYLRFHLYLLSYRREVYPWMFISGFREKNYQTLTYRKHPLRYNDITKFDHHKIVIEFFDC